MINICAILIAYNPCLSVTPKAIFAIADQVDKVYVIDNGSKVPFDGHLDDFKNVECISLANNLGIAAAFNVGIKAASKAGYKYAVLLDQDSLSPENMVSRYLEVARISASDKNVAVIGPRYRDPKTQHTSRFVRYNWFRNSYHGGFDEASCVKADFLISSGSFFELSVFETIGLFDESLFIDHVDTEWCHRARNLGFYCLGVWDVIMEHSLGESGVRLWLFRWRIQPIHKPFRLYYIFRNSLLLYKMPHTTLKWVSSDVLRLLRLTVIYIVFSDQRFKVVKWMVRGFKDGLCGVTGPISD